ncbi:hypothetical protein [Acinetobacter equi]|uniref:Lipoprotein n=1 Tax=Acinetobacter equi TaxID=1324350 RepID=A0A0N9VVR6_9GAMM|nr:hypothetical protein [Acinetobacter equi]ALH95229.1 hypothetical protein AOY20_06575 [Acinetobacter equi]
MKTFKHLVLPLSIIVLLLSACSNQTTETKTAESMSEEISQSSGNWQAKVDELSNQNVQEIKEDLSQLNKIVDHLNSQSEQLRSEIVLANQDTTKIKKILEKSQVMQQKGLLDLMNLNLKTSEVQAIRTKMIENLMLTEQMHDLSNQEDFDMKNPSAEFKNLALRSQILQKDIFVELDHLNNEFQ